MCDGGAWLRHEKVARDFWGLCFAGLESVGKGVSGSDTALKSAVK